MVGRGGLEPPTSRLSGVRSNHLSYRPIPARPCKLPASHEKQARIAATGGARRDRTDDLMLAKHALSQLSYGPRRYKGRTLMRADPKSCSFSEEERETKTADIRTCKATGSDKIRVYCSKCSKDLINDCSKIMVERNILRKEVIQPQVPLRLPCYDFTPVADPTVVGCLPCGLAHHLRVKPTPMV